MAGAAHPLDNPIWRALTSRQAAFGGSGPLARRFREDVSPFAAAADNSAEAVAALAALAHADDDMSLLQRAPPAPPPGVTLKMSAPGVQMIGAAFGADHARFSFDALSEADAPEMAALALLTKPAPGVRRRTRWAAFSAFATAAASRRWRASGCVRTGSSR